MTYHLIRNCLSDCPCQIGAQHWRYVVDEAVALPALDAVEAGRLSEAGLIRVMGG